MVAEDIDAAMAELSAALGLTWCGGKPTEMDLVIFGEERRVTMRIAHSLQGPPHVELIQAVPDTPWAAPSAPGVHHLCYWSEDAGKQIARLEAARWRRALGPAGASTGYLLSPSGAYVEIIDPPLHDRLSSWIAAVREKAQSGVV